MTNKPLFHITDRTGKVLYTNLTRHTRLEGYGWQHLSGGGFLLDSQIKLEGWTVCKGGTP